METPYVDKSGNERSIHRLEQRDLTLIYEAVIELFNKYPKESTKVQKEEKRRLVRIKKAIANEVPVY